MESVTDQQERKHLAEAQQKRTKSIDISSIQSAFHRVEKNADSGNANNLRKFLGELQRAVEEALK